MIASWMLYALVTALLLSAAAAAAEGALRRLGLPGRWVWVAAMAGSLALAAAPWLLDAPAPAAEPETALAPVGRVIELPALELGGSPVLDRLDRPLLALWAGGSLAVLAALAGGAVGLARRRRRWTPAELDGRSVLLSDDFGPAVVGLVRPGVVLPRWVAALDPAARRMVLLHEEEHRRACDVPLLVATAGLAALLPWNAPLWLQLRRLRSAVELDCDRRVLGRGASPLPYADLLLRVGGRGAGMLSPALAEPARTLQRRLEMIVKQPNRWNRFAAVALAGVASLLVALACETPSPPEVADQPADPTSELGAGESSDPITDLAGEPLVFVDGVERGRLGSPPAGDLSDLDPDDIERVEVVKGEAAVEMYGERGENGVVQIFTKAVASSARDLAAEPTFTPFTTAPDILNREEVIAAMEREYPPLVRDAGIGGQVRVHFLIDESGRVRETRLDQTSGHQALDEAALSVAGVYRFSPALNGDEPTPVWISLPITFQPGT